MKYSAFNPIVLFLNSAKDKPSFAYEFIIVFYCFVSSQLLSEEVVVVCSVQIAVEEDVVPVCLFCDHINSIVEGSEKQD